ncbi:hypothetical protein RND71_013200 [Anisodus tanguticus]|uniref:Uncharacterized protein n=1 Tax=Anisodus tanguticus TaxID=243964 RepID=A0AAE1SHE7_9SOLA|nr:hypothetical protein RND71_013200 [Anisodus tanguticus]
MAKPSISKSLYGVLFIVFLLSGVEAKECNEGLPWVTTECEGEEPGGQCWNECQNRHGLSVKASCRDSVALPTQFCWCSWSC